MAAYTVELHTEGPHSTLMERLTVDPCDPIWTLFMRHEGYMILRPGTKIPIRALRTPIGRLGTRFECVRWTFKYEYLRKKVEKMAAEHNIVYQD